MGWTGGSTSIDSIHYSLDTGRTWVFAAKFPGGARHTFGFVCNRSNYYIIGTDAFFSPIGKADVWRMGNSPRNWTNINNAPPFGNRIFQQVVSLDGFMYLLGGQNTYVGASPTIFRDVWKSADGITWTQVCASCAPNIGNTSGTCTSWRGRIWVIAGEYYADTHIRHKTIYSSKDGITWTQHSDLPIAAGLSYPKAFVWGGKLWVYGGYGSSNTSTLLYTTNGLSNWINASYVGMRETHAAAVAQQNPLFWVVTSGNWQSAPGDINRERQKVVKSN